MAATAAAATAAAAAAAGPSVGLQLDAGGCRAGSSAQQAGGGSLGSYTASVLLLSLPSVCLCLCVCVWWTAVFLNPSVVGGLSGTLEVVYLALTFYFYIFPILKTSISQCVTHAVVQHKLSTNHLSRSQGQSEVKVKGRRSQVKVQRSQVEGHRVSQRSALSVYLESLSGIYSGA